MAGDSETIPVPTLSSDGPGQPVPVAPPPGEKKKRHRRTKAELATARAAEGAPASAPGPDPEDVKKATAALAMTFKAIGAIVADKRGEHWRLEDKEADKLGEVWAIVLAPYMPRVAAASPVVFALASTWLVVQPRMEEDRRQAARRHLEAEPDAATPALVKS